MAVVDSRLLKGTITFGETDNEYACQVTSFVIEQTDGDTDDTVTTLCGDTVGGGTGLGPWHMTGTAIQDFDSPAGFQKYSYENRGVDQPFEFTPNDKATTPTITGTVTVKFLGIGGDTNARLTRDFDWAITEEPTLEWPPPVAPLATGASAGEPGTFTPAGSEAPADGAAVEELVSSP